MEDTVRDGDMRPLFETIVREVAPPCVEQIESLFQVCEVNATVGIEVEIRIRFQPVSYQLFGSRFGSGSS